MVLLLLLHFHSFSCKDVQSIFGKNQVLLFLVDVGQHISRGPKSFLGKRVALAFHFFAACSCGFVKKLDLKMSMVARSRCIYSTHYTR